MTKKPKRLSRRTQLSRSNSMLVLAGRPGPLIARGTLEDISTDFASAIDDFPVDVTSATPSLFSDMYSGLDVLDTGF